MRRQVINSGNISTGELHRFEASLSSNDQINGMIEIPMIGFTQASVSVMTIGATGTSGTVKIKQSIRSGNVAADFSPAVAMTITSSSTTEEYGIQVSGGYLIIDVSQMTFGQVGRFEIVVAIKR